MFRGNKHQLRPGFSCYFYMYDTSFPRFDSLFRGIYQLRFRILDDFMYDISVPRFDSLFRGKTSTSVPGFRRFHVILDVRYFRSEM